MAISIFRSQGCCPRAESPDGEVTSREAGASSGLHREERAGFHTPHPPSIDAKTLRLVPTRVYILGVSHISAGVVTATNSLPLSTVAPPAGLLLNPNPSGSLPGPSPMSS